MLLNSDILNAGALVLPLAGAVVQRRFGETHAADRGLRTCANGQWGFPRNLGDPVVSVLNRGSKGVPHPNRLAPRPCRVSVEARSYRHKRTVSPSEGNEVRRDGRQEVVVP
jgi:hypothetical protein